MQKVKTHLVGCVHANCLGESAAVPHLTFIDFIGPNHCLGSFSHVSRLGLPFMGPLVFLRIVDVRWRLLPAQLCRAMLSASNSRV